MFPGIAINVGAQGTFAKNMIAGTAGSALTQDQINAGAQGVVGDVRTYTEVAVSDVRYRLATSGADVTATGSVSAKALFVGQGVDGPLGVIGTWTLSGTTGVGRVAPDGSHTDDLNATITGAFGAQVP